MMTQTLEQTNGLRLRRSSEVARNAFKDKNSAASREYHAKVWEEPHKTNNIKKNYDHFMELTVSFSRNGIITTGIIISAFAGFCRLFSTTIITPSSSLPTETLFVICFVLSLAVVVGHGLSLGYIDYWNKKEYKDFYHSEMRREQWEYDNFIEGEQREMVELYVGKGLPREDAETVIRILSRDKSIFVDMMMKEELELPAPNAENHFAGGLVIFFSSLVFGSLPIIPLAFWFYYRMLTVEQMVTYSLLISVASLFICGICRSRFNVAKWWICAFLTALNGIFAFGVAYLIAFQLSFHLFI